MWTLTTRSWHRLEGVHPDLVRVVELALGYSKVEFQVVEGMRTKARQEALVFAGASQTMNSRHLTGHAVDLAAFVEDELRWDWPLYKQVANAMKLAAAELGVEIVWGGDWRTFKDGPHFELNRKVYA